MEKYGSTIADLLYICRCGLNPKALKRASASEAWQPPLMGRVDSLVCSCQHRVRSISFNRGICAFFLVSTIPCSPTRLLCPNAPNSCQNLWVLLFPPCFSLGNLRCRSCLCHPHGVFINMFRDMLLDVLRILCKMLLNFHYNVLLFAMIFPKR